MIHKMKPCGCDERFPYKTSIDRFFQDRIFWCVNCEEEILDIHSQEELESKGYKFIEYIKEIDDFIYDDFRKTVKYMGKFNHILFAEFVRSGKKDIEDFIKDFKDQNERLLH